jgi:signal transduction histidine kinase/CheY-like chemotaxis protein
MGAMFDWATSRRHPAGADDRFRAEQISGLYQNAPVGVIGALLGGVVVVGVLVSGDLVPMRVAASWIGILTVVAACHLLLCLIHRRRRPPAGEWRRWAFGFTAAAFAEGCTWGAGSIALITPDRIDQQLWVMLATSAVASGSASAFGSYLPAFYALMFPAMAPYVVWSLTHAGLTHQALAFMDLLYMGAMSAIGWRSNRNLVEALRLRFENVDLVENLRVEKERAEQANLDKSRFLASASHDLRQPVHALSLFVGALLARRMEPDVRRLVEQIDGSVIALDSLFTSLLDISRLDAGIVLSSPQSFAIQPLLDRVCRDYEGEAQRKGIGLVLHPCALAVRTDPILLERVLRNLVSNAVRYTSHGRVVVGCRRGAVLGIEIWDTGPGIPPEEQGRIFQEFYQLGNPERDRGKGLGLGLAIVQRLTALLEAPITLRSVVGKGSVFWVAVPVAEDAVPEIDAAPTALPDATARGPILLIDDEAAIREAMHSLLSSWGHEVIVGGSGDDMLAQIATVPTRPSLIISDYRLRGEENGISVIRRLQSEYNDDIPAMLITGDTAPDRLKEAQESGLLLLHKPIHNSKLRAAITNLLARAAESEAE